jgi:ribosomal protein L37E
MSHYEKWGRKFTEEKKELCAIIGIPASTKISIHDLREQAGRAKPPRGSAMAVATRDVPTMNVVSSAPSPSPAPRERNGIRFCPGCCYDLLPIFAAVELRNTLSPSGPNNSMRYCPSCGFDMLPISLAVRNS